MHVNNSELASSGKQPNKIRSVCALKHALENYVFVCLFVCFLFVVLHAVFVLPYNLHAFTHIDLRFLSCTHLNNSALELITIVKVNQE